MLPRPADGRDLCNYIISGSVGSLLLHINPRYLGWVEVFYCFIHFIIPLLLGVALMARRLPSRLRVTETLKLRPQCIGCNGNIPYRETDDGREVVPWISDGPGRALHSLIPSTGFLDPITINIQKFQCHQGLGANFTWPHLYTRPLQVAFFPVLSQS